jgi:hypothetical protein
MAQSTQRIADLDALAGMVCRLADAIMQLHAHGVGKYDHGAVFGQLEEALRSGVAEFTRIASDHDAMKNEDHSGLGTLSKLCEAVEAGAEEFERIVRDHA